jgi:hypothetical protein
MNQMMWHASCDPSPLVGEGWEGVLTKTPPSRLTSFAGLTHMGGGNRNCLICEAG